MRWTVVPTKVHPTQPSCLSETLVLRVSNFFTVSSYGHLQRTVIPVTVHPVQPLWWSETPLLRVSILYLSSPWRTSTMDRHYHDGLSCWSLITGRYFPYGSPHNHSWSKTWRIHEGPSYSRRAITWSVVFHYFYRDVITTLPLYLFLCHFFLSCLLLLVLILILYRYYL